MQVRRVATWLVAGLVLWGVGSGWCEESRPGRFGLRTTYLVPAEAGLNSVESYLEAEYFVPWEGDSLRVSLEHVKGGGHLPVSGELLPVNRSLTGVVVAELRRFGGRGRRAREPRFYTGWGVGYCRVETHAWDSSGTRMSTTDFIMTSEMLAGMQLTDGHYWELGWDTGRVEAFGRTIDTGGLRFSYGWRF